MNTLPANTPFNRAMGLLTICLGAASAAGAQERVTLVAGNPSGLEIGIDSALGVSLWFGAQGEPDPERTVFRPESALAWAIEMQDALTVALEADLDMPFEPLAGQPYGALGVTDFVTDSARSVGTLYVESATLRTAWRIGSDHLLAVARRIELSALDAMQARESGVVYADDVDERPMRTGGPSRSYPIDLFRRRVDGTVWLRYVVEVDGKVLPNTVRVLEATEPGFVNAALSFVLDGEYAPGKVDGTRVRTEMFEAVRFNVP